MEVTVTGQSQEFFGRFLQNVWCHVVTRGVRGQKGPAPLAISDTKCVVLIHTRHTHTEREAPGGGHTLRYTPAQLRARARAHTHTHTHTHTQRERETERLTQMSQL